MSAPARPAATAILLRDGPHGPQVLLLRRSGRLGFFPHAWVFPGGRVDPGDAGATRQGAVAGGVPALDADLTIASAVAAVRETFEEAGIWLGTGPATAELRRALYARRITLADTPELVADLGRLALWSWWITPEIEPKRYDTRFFLAVVDEEEALLAEHDRIESTDMAWLEPSEALDRACDEVFFLAPPTFRTLEELAPFESAAAAWAAAVERPVHPTMPRVESAPDGSWRIVLPGDPTYPSDRPITGPTRIVFREGRWHSTPA